MKDRYNRTIDYVRISITDRCNYHCVYCNPDKFKFLSHNDILRYEEILDICKVAVKLGIVNFKVTGGEPTVRKGYLSFLRQIKQLEGVRQVTLTTNGLLLDARTMDELKDIGIDGINFSIDTLDSKKYASICGKDTLDTVLNNLLYGVSIGLNIKINTVVGPLFTQSDLEGLIDFCENLPVSLRFIELMPLGSNKRENKIEEVQSYFASHYNIEEIIPKLKAYTTGNVVDKVTCSEKRVLKGNGKRVALLDLGAKNNIAQSLNKRGCEVTIYPAHTTAEEILATNPDGIMLSNGPGDPKECKEIIAEIKKLYDSDTPIFAICLGHQLMALATGADTHKMKYGHRGGNHPVKDLETGRVYISSQNHGYVVDPKIAKPAFVNVNDGTNEGLSYVGKNIFTVQFHPEACPGPQDSAYLFDRFISMM